MQQLNYVSVRAAIGGIIGLSVAASLFLMWLIYVKPTTQEYAQTFTFLPTLNALLNSLSAISVCFGLFYIRKGNQQIHRRLMFTALIFSSLFLVSYVLNYTLRGDTHFLGTGLVRPIYFLILITHVLLSIIALPMVLVTVFFSLTERFVLHRRVARFTAPIWLYVSVTGVIVFLLQLIYPTSN